MRQGAAHWAAYGAEKFPSDAVGGAPESAESKSQPLSMCPTECRWLFGKRLDGAVRRCAFA